MSVEHLTWRYVGAQSFVSATVAAVLDALYTLGTKTTYADSTTRTEGSGSAWTYTGNRYQNGGTTEALYPSPPTSTLGGRILLAGAATLPTPNPTPASPDSAAANVLMGNVVKNAGAFSTWNAASPFTSGQTFGYWRIWATSSGTGSVYLWEGKDALMIQITAGSSVVGWIGGAIGDPNSTDSLDAETDEKVYGQITTGSAAGMAVDFGSNNNSFLGHSATASSYHAGIFQPGSSTILTAAPRGRSQNTQTTTSLRLRSGKYARVPIDYRFTAGAPNDGFAFRLRDIMWFSDAQSGQKQTNGGTTIGYIAAASATVAQDALMLEHA